MQVCQGSNADISREPPVRAKPKGRKMTETEKQSATFGAKGPKLGTRRCHESGKYTTHNARTCPTLPHNQKCLGAVKLLDRPMELRGGSERPRTRGSVTPTRLYDALDSGSEDHDDMDIDN
jgi:hypothetical protein